MSTDVKTRPPLIQLQRNYNQLTNKKKNIVELTARGFSEKEIADLADITVGTVKFHKTEIFKLLGIRSSVAELTSVYYSLNLDLDKTSFNELDLVRKELLEVSAERDEYRKKYEDQLLENNKLLQKYSFLPSGKVG